MNNHVVKKNLFLFFILTCFLIISKNSFAVTITWDGGGADNNWSTAENWSGDTIPGSSDIAYFDGTSTKDATIDAGFAGDISGLSVNTGYSGTITQQTDLNIGLADFYLNSGTYTVSSGNISVTGDFTTTFNASFNHANTLTMARYGTLTMDVTHSLVNLVIDNNDGTITNLAGGTIVVTGTLTLTDGILNNGDIDASGGDITFDSTFDGGTGQIYTGGTNVIAITLNGGASVPGYEIDNPNASAVTSGSGTLTFSEDFRMSNGSFTNSGNLDILFGTSSEVTQLGGSIDLGDSGAATVTFKNNFTIQGGTFDGGAVSIIFFGANDNLIIEGGTFTSTSGTLSIVEDMTHIVGGTFNHNNGKFLFNGNAHSNVDCNSSIATSCVFYDLEVNKDSTIYVLAPFTGDTMTVENELTYTQGKFNTGTLLAEGNVTITDMNTGTGTLEIGGTAATTVTLTAGASLSKFHMNNPNTNVTTTGTGTLSFDNTVTVEDGTFTNDGNIDVRFNAVINQSGGTLDFGDNTGTNIIIDNDLNLSGGTFDLGSTNASTQGANDDIIITGGTFISTSQNLSLGDNFSHTTSGTFDHNNGFVVFDNSGSGSTLTCDSAVATSCQFYDFEINKNGLTVGINSDPATVLNEAYLTDGKFDTGTIKFESTTLIADTFDGGTATLEFSGTNVTTATISGGAILPKVHLNNPNVTVGTDSVGTVTFDNDVTITDGSFVNSGNNDISFDGGASLTIVGGSFDLGDSDATTVTFRDALSISGGSFDGGATDMNFVTTNADLFISGGTFTSTSNNLTTTADWSHITNGTFDHNNGNVIYDLIGAVTITCDDTVATSCVFNNFSTTGSSGLDTNIDSNDPMTVEGTLSSDDGRLRTGTIYVKGDVDLNVGYDDGNANLYFTGTADQILDITGVTGAINGDVTIDKSSGTVTLASDFTLDAALGKDFTIVEGRFKTNGYNFDVSTNSSEFFVQDGGIFEINGNETLTFDPGYPDLQSGSTVVYSGAVINDIQDWDYHHLEINNASGEFFLPGTMSLAGDLTITAGSLATNGNDLTVTGTFSNEDTFKMIGTETLTLTMDVDSGTVVYEGNGDGSADIFSILDNGVTDYYNLVINDPGATKDTFQLTDALVVANALTISDGELDQNSNPITAESFEQDGGTFTGNSGDITLNSTFTMTGGTFTATADTLYLGGDFSHTSGTFTHNNGEVAFDGTDQQLSGATTFYDFTKTVSSAATLTFPQDATTTIAGLATLQGASSNLLSLRSSVGASSATVDFSGTRSFSYLDVQDIENLDSASATCLTGCTDSGNNTNWTFELLISLSLTDSPFAENGGIATVTATLDTASDLDTTVNLAFSGTATNIDDYTRSGTSIVISAGDTTGSVTLTGVNDTLDEDTETVIVDVDSVTNATEDGTQQVTASISDDDTPPTVSLSVSDSPFAENAGTATVTATLSAESGKDVTVNFSFSGTAANISDYTRSATSVVISAGSTTGSITLTGVDDAVDEASETVIVDIDSVTNGTESGTQQVTANITDDDAAPNVSLSLTNSPLAENGGAATVTATLDAASEQDVTVNLAFSGTAINVSDYTRSATSITISAGDTTGSITITGVDDSLDEANETVIVDIDSITNGTESGTQQVTATITDDDNGVNVSLSVADSPFAENGGVATITATLAAISGQDVTVNLAFSGTATNVTDYTRSATSITISAGDTTGSITLTGVNDALDEANETVIIDIDSVTNGTESGTQQVTATITDDDNGPTVALSLTDSPLAEDSGVATVTATLSAISGQDVTVTLAFTGSATNTSDYTRTANSITISAGDTTGSISLTGVDDSLDEDNETIIVDINTVTNATESGTQQVTATITDDDATPTIEFSTTSQSADEGNTALTATVSLSAVSGRDVTVTFTPHGDSTATEDEDYTLSASPLTISAGDSSANVTITLIADDFDEDDETVLLDLSSPTNATLATNTRHTVTITNDDTAGITITETSGQTQITEAGATDTYTVVLDSEPTNDVTVTITTDDDSETDVSELTFTSDDWDTPQTVTVTATDDDLQEGTHSSTISHALTSDDTDYDGLSEDVTATVTDNDTAGISVSEINGSVEEGGSANYSFVLTSEPTDDVVIQITTDSQASVSASTLTFTSVNWDDAQTVTITITDDSDAEGNHSTTLSHTASSDDTDYDGFVISDTVVQITDNESVGVLFINEDDGTALTPGDVTNTLSVVLTSEPTANVVISISTGDNVDFDTSLLIFTPANWDTAQEVVASLAANATVSNSSATVSASASSEDTDYDEISITPLTLSLDDPNSEEEEEETPGEEEEEEETEEEDDGVIVSTGADCKNVTAIAGRPFNLGSNCSGLSQNTDDTRNVTYTWSQISGKTVGLCREARLLCKVNIPANNEEKLVFKLVIKEDGTTLFSDRFTVNPFKSILTLDDSGSTDSGIDFAREENIHVIGSRSGFAIRITDQTNGDNYYEIDLGNNVTVYSDYFIDANNIATLDHGILLSAPLQFNARGLLILIDAEAKNTDYYLDDPDLALQDGILAVSEGQQIGREFGFPLIASNPESETVLTFSLGGVGDEFYGIGMILDSETLETLAIIRGSNTDRLTSKNVFNKFKKNIESNHVVLGTSSSVDSSVNASFLGLTATSETLQVLDNNFGEVFDLSEDEADETIDYDEVTHLLSGDFDDDGVADLVAIAGETCEITIFFTTDQSSSNIFVLDNDLACSQDQAITSAITGDVNNDDIDDIILGFSETDEIYIILGSADLRTGNLVLEDQAIIISGSAGTGDWLVIGDNNIIYTSDGAGGSLAFNLVGNANTIGSGSDGGPFRGSGGCQLDQNNTDQQQTLWMSVLGLIFTGLLLIRRRVAN